MNEETANIIDAISTTAPDPIDDIINAVLKSVEWAKVGEFYNPIIPASEREYVRTKIKVAIEDFIDERRKKK